MFCGQSRHRKKSYAEYNDAFDNTEWQQKIPEFFKFNLSTYLTPKYLDRVDNKGFFANT